MLVALLFLAPAALAFGGGPKRPRGLALRAGAAAVEERAPALTLYRDTNGWCPFCERVWVALEKKGIPYDEVLIDLQDKPDWYKEIVPTTLVPAIEFHDDAWDASARGSGRLVWESADILEALDAEFGGPALAGAEAPLQKRVLETSVGFVYGPSNRTATELFLAERAFAKALDALDADLAARGPFVGGAALSARDLELVPTMERFYYQLRVLKPDFPPLDAGRPGLKAWFAAMDAEPAYGRRVKGDAYSWTAVTSSFLRIFRGDDPATAAKVAAADAAAAAMLDACVGDRAALRDAPAVAEAREKLAANRAAVARDASDPEPKTQPGVPRAAAAASADAAIDAALDALRPRRRVARALRRVRGAAPLDDDARVAAAAIAARVCAPRDMSAPAARALRHVLLQRA